MPLNFVKMHANGDDFVLIDARGRTNPITRELARTLGDRRRGIGFNQLVVLGDCSDSAAQLTFFNADGSSLDTCGSATRGAADLLMQESGVTSVQVKTARGLQQCLRLEDRSVSVEMGLPSFDWQSIPLARELDSLPLHSLKWIRGGFADSALSEREHQLVPFICRYLRDTDVVFSTWRADGNLDHEAVGRATAEAASLVGARFHEIPIWAWHWAAREEHHIPWQRARKLRLDTWTVARKRHAAHAYASQLQGEPEIGLEPSLSPVLLERLRVPYEIILM